jgi:thiamine kinase-like enzyme
MKFLKERDVYLMLNKSQFKHFNYPRLIEHDNTSLTIEYYEGVKGWDDELISSKQVIKSLIEFNMLLINNKEIQHKRFDMINLIRNPNFSIIKGILLNFYQFKHTIIIRLFYGMLLQTINKSPEKKFLVHGDVSRYQNLITTNSKLIFIDFESVLITRNFYLIDIIGLAINYKNLRLNRMDWLDINLVINYLQEMPYKFKSKDIKLQIYLVLIYKVINSKDEIVRNNVIDQLSNYNKFDSVHLCLLDDYFD